MSKIETGIRNDEIAVIRYLLDSDGHLIENAASLIVRCVASVWDRFDNPKTAIGELTKAFEGKQSEIPQDVVHRLIVLRAVLGDQKEIADAAIKAGVFSSAENRRKLRKAYYLSTLRDVALEFTIPDAEGKNVTTLGDIIQNSRLRN